MNDRIAFLIARLAGRVEARANRAGKPTSRPRGRRALPAFVLVGLVLALGGRRR